MLSKIAKKLQALSDKLTYRHWIIISAIISVLLGVLVYMSVKEAAKPVEQTAVEKLKVVVAKSDINARTVIEEGMLEVRDVPVNLIPADAVKNIKDVVNKPAKMTILKDDILSNRKVLKDIKMAGFTGVIPPDSRAVSVAISDVTGVAGFAQPGDKVDVMLVSKQNEKMLGRILLQDVQLLAINKVQNNANETASDKDANVKAKATEKPVTATLALKSDEVLKLITEAQGSTIYLALRPYQPQDGAVVETVHEYYEEPVLDDVMPPNFTGMAGGEPPVQVPAYTRPRGNVEVIRGTTITRE